ncbi:MAG: UDP-4-amino-4,6-dideoxy-N-acetyl-beta-L-altrosamine N-acetyltransferase [Gammaproteobacteria bacterium]|nr:UDP-4-amino-4,6-dideoxy-N-acetyl-beta-L-altrosamine N-acetyltransferase [Gammaproteobacteria bacterium]
MIDSAQFKLRPLAEHDLELVLAWRNSERVRANMYTDHVISLDEHRRWFERLRDHPTPEKYLIFESAERPLGFVSFTRFNVASDLCYWAFYLGETEVPRGTGAIMEFMAIEYALRELKLRKLCCEVFVFNAPVIKLHHRFGFIEEGRLKEHMLKAGKYEDIVSLALFERDWENIRPSLYKLCFR